VASAFDLFFWSLILTYLLLLCFDLFFLNSAFDLYSWLCFRSLLLPMLQRPLFWTFGHCFCVSLWPLFLVSVSGLSFWPMFLGYVSFSAFPPLLLASALGLCVFDLFRRLLLTSSISGFCFWPLILGASASCVCIWPPLLASASGPLFLASVFGLCLWPLLLGAAAGLCFGPLLSGLCLRSLFPCHLFKVSSSGLFFCLCFCFPIPPLGPTRLFLFALNKYL
jgi:hypothetical protein